MHILFFFSSAGTPSFFVLIPRYDSCTQKDPKMLLRTDL